MNNVIRLVVVSMLMYSSMAMSEDIGPIIQATTSMEVKTSSPVLWIFKTSKYANYSRAGLPAETSIQWNPDGTSSTIRRGAIYEMLYISNSSTYTIYLLTNDESLNIRPTRYWIALRPNSYVVATKETSGWLFPLSSVSAYVEHDTTNEPTGITSATLSIKGR